MWHLPTFCEIFQIYWETRKRKEAENWSICNVRYSLGVHCVHFCIVLLDRIILVLKGRNRFFQSFQKVGFVKLAVRKTDIQKKLHCHCTRKLHWFGFQQDCDQQLYCLRATYRVKTRKQHIDSTLKFCLKQRGVGSWKGCKDVGGAFTDHELEQNKWTEIYHEVNGYCRSISVRLFNFIVNPHNFIGNPSEQNISLSPRINCLFLHDFNLADWFVLRFLYFKKRFIQFQAFK